VPNPDEVAALIARNARGARAARGFSLDTLAARSGVSRGMLVQIEQARTNPTAWTLVRVADALGVSVADLLHEPVQSDVRVYRASERTTVWRGDAGGVSVLLSGGSARGSLELWEWSLPPGETYHTDGHVPGTREVVSVLAGAVELNADGERAVLATGDSAFYRGDRPHGFSCAGEEPCRFVMATSVPAPD
jgi:transcriptional regulator with XRE-family HTH domain